MSAVSPAMRFRLSGEQNHRCAYCGVEMLFPRELQHPKYGAASRTDAARAEFARVVTFEHLRARSFGGSDSWWNGVAACRFCNSFRGTAPASEAFRAIQHLVREGRHPHQVFAATGVWEPIPHMRYVPPPPGLRGEPHLVVMRLLPPEGAIIVDFDHTARVLEHRSPAGMKSTVQAMRAEAARHGVRLQTAAVVRQSRLLPWAQVARARVMITHATTPFNDDDLWRH